MTWSCRYGMYDCASVQGLSVGVVSCMSPDRVVLSIGRARPGRVMRSALKVRLIVVVMLSLSSWPTNVLRTRWRVDSVGRAMVCGSVVISGPWANASMQLVVMTGWMCIVSSMAALLRSPRRGALTVRVDGRELSIDCRPGDVGAASRHRAWHTCIACRVLSRRQVWFGGLQAWQECVASSMPTCDSFNSCFVRRAWYLARAAVGLRVGCACR